MPACISFSVTTFGISICKYKYTKNIYIYIFFFLYFLCSLDERGDDELEIASKFIDEFLVIVDLPARLVLYSSVSCPHFIRALLTDTTRKRNPVRPVQKTKKKGATISRHSEFDFIDSLPKELLRPAKARERHSKATFSKKIHRRGTTPTR